MGTKYSTVAITGYNQTPPSDDGAQTSANKVKWSTIKTKLGDPVNDALESVNTALVAAFDVGPNAQTATYTTTATDYAKVLEITNLSTVNLLAAATATAGYHVTVKNAGASNVTVASGESIDGEASVLVLPKEAKTFHVNAAATAYMATSETETPRFETYVTKVDGGGATYEFTDLEAGADYRFVLRNLVPVTDDTTFNVRLSIDNGSTFISSAGSYRYTTGWASSNGTDGDTSALTDTAWTILGSGIGVSNAAADGGANMTIFLYNPNSASQNTMMSSGPGTHPTSTNLITTMSAGTRLNAEANNAIQFLFGSGNITSGTIEMWKHVQQ